MRMKIGIFGGTFDPPHIGHLILAEAAWQQLQLNHILWALTPFPPHKKDHEITSLEDRLAMVLLAIAGNRKFRLSRIDIDRQPPHYAVDTMRLLLEQRPEDEHFYLMGADSLNDLPTWHEPARFVALCRGIGVMMRTGENIDIVKVEAQFPGIGEKLHFLDTPQIEIAGSDIRRRIAEGKPFRYFVPDRVHRYIVNHKLYQ